VDEHTISPAGDPFYATGARRTEPELVEALAEDEAKQGRPHTRSERDAFARGFFSEDYRAEIRQLMACGLEEGSS
jgi:hypothetical protein